MVTTNYVTEHVMADGQSDRYAASLVAVASAGPV